METWFASPERAPEGECQTQAAALADHPLVNILLDSVEGYLVILNGQRQVVSANEDFLSLLGCGDLSRSRGLRFGELLGCRNSSLTEGGCGTSRLCANCGAVLATVEVLESQTPAARECHLSTLVDGRPGSREFRVKASPLTVGGELFVVVIFQDISSDKRRQVLEQIFLHDLSNILGGLCGFSELLSMQNGDQFVDKVVSLSRLLRGEVESHNLLVRAEAGDFHASHETLDLRAVVGSVAEVFGENPCARGKSWKTVLGEGVVCRADRTVVVRILVNMVKNAYEASEPGDEVVLEIQPQGTGTRFTVSNPAVMAPEVADRIFERTFSTKGTPGRGLGTYAMRLLAEGFLGGHVSFTSVTGDGTRFNLYLP